MFYFITKRMHEHTHEDGTTHSHEANEHVEDQFNAKKEMAVSYTHLTLPTKRIV